jgi:hypothetical protein
VPRDDGFACFAQDDDNSRATTNAKGAPLVSKSDIMHVYEVRPRSNNRGVDLISDVLPFGRLSFSGRHPRQGKHT